MAFGIFKKFNLGLKKTRETMSGAIDAAISENEDITDQLYDDLEEILIMGDVGMNTSAEICEKLREYVAKHHLKNPLRSRAQSRRSFRKCLRAAKIWVLSPCRQSFLL